MRVCLLCLLRHCSLRFLLPLALCPEGPGSCGGCAVHCGKPRAGVMGQAVAHSAQQRPVWLELRRARVDGLRVDQPPRSLADRSFDKTFISSDDPRYIQVISSRAHRRPFF